MSAGPKSLLTTRQAECLRLVPTTSGSKEIASILGIEPGTVDQHIKAATKALSENSRHAAARKFAAMETAAPVQKLDSQPPAVADHAFSLPTEVTAAAGQPLGADWMMRERQAPFVVDTEPKPGFSWPIATKGQPHNRLTWKETLVASWALSLVLCAVSGVSIIAVVLLMNFLITVSTHGG